MTKILVVEDELFIADELKASLEKLHYSVIGPCCTGKDAMHLINDCPPDVVLMDINIEGELDGIQTADRIRNDFDIPVVFVTAHSNKQTLSRAALTHPYGYVLKPAQDIELHKSIELALLNFAEEKVEGLPSQHGEEVDVELFNEVSNVKTDEIFNVLQRLPVLEEIHHKVLRSIASRCHITDYEKGACLVSEEDKDVDGFLILSGCILMKRSSESGKELVVETLTDGSIFSLSVATTWNPYPVRLETASKTKILWMPHKSVVELFKLYPKLNQSVLSDAYSRLEKAHDTSRALAHDRVELRIAKTLLMLSISDIESTSSVIEITRQQLADTVGTTLETAVRVTKNMERNNWLDLTKRGCINVVNRNKLAEFVEDYLS